jgi:hypothetical protein
LPEWIAYAAANGVHFDDAKPAAITAADPGFVLADAPYINWSDGALAYDLFNDGANNVFAPSGPPLTANALTGPASDIRGIARPNPPSIGAYDVVAAAMGGVHDVPVLGPWALAALFGLLGLGGSLAVSRRRQD